ncbi:MAG: SRPBCC family protein [Bacteroidota bacterium]|nr:SRPBCC family protein [Bacteroidota bacterium]
MRAYKWIGSAVLIVIALFLVTSLFLPPQYRVERSIVIYCPIETVYSNVADLTTWSKWNSLVMSDLSARYTFSGSPRTAGHKMTWLGTQIASGSIELEEVSLNKFISSKLKLSRADLLQSNDFWIFTSVKKGTKLTWADQGDLSYPAGRYYGLLLDGMLGPEMEKGLSKLKLFCEQRQ